MARVTVNTSSLLFAFATLSSIMAATMPIGLVTSNGRFEIDHLPVWSNGTIFDASIVQTVAAASRLQLNEGARLRLGADSRVQVFQQHAVLERGIGELEGSV